MTTNLKNNIITAADSQTERILTIDVLRGFALFGILFSHMIFWYSGGPLTPEYYNPNGNIFSMIAIGTYMIFFIGKFFALFSFLFGLSFFIQMRSLEQRGDNFVIRFAWRLAILGAIGVAHHMLWRADILSIYVPLGFILLFFRNLSNRTLFVLGVIFVLNLPTKIAELSTLLMTHQITLIPTDNKVDAAYNLAAFHQTSWIELLKSNLATFKDKWIYQVNSGRGFITFGYFLLGMLAGRLGIFERIQQHRDSLVNNTKRLWKLLGVILVCNLILGGCIGLFKIDMEHSPGMQWAFGFLAEFFNAAMTLLYIHLITRLMLNTLWQQRLAGFAAIGKMALTTYLTQSLIGVVLFFNVGLGLLGITTQAQNILLCFAIFALQLLFCKWWLTHFHYGPLEWLWRSATYLRWQPFRKKALEFAAA